MIFLQSKKTNNEKTVSKHKKLIHSSVHYDSHRWMCSYDIEITSTVDKNDEVCNERKKEEEMKNHLFEIRWLTFLNGGKEKKIPFLNRFVQQNKWLITVDWVGLC